MQIRDSLIEKGGTSKEEKFQVSSNFDVLKLIKEKMIPLEINSRYKCYQYGSERLLYFTNHLIIGAALTVQNSITSCLILPSFVMNQFFGSIN